MSNNLALEAQVRQPSVQVTPEPDLKFYGSSWIWRAVECLVQSKDFNPSPRWISERLNISVDKAVDAIEGLQRLDLIRRTESGYIPTNLLTTFGSPDLSRKELLQIQSRIAPQILTKVEPQDAFTTQIFLGNRALVRRFVPKLLAVFDEMNAAGIEEGLTEVMALEISFANLTKEIINKEVKQ
jgi:hypothetical protein